MFFRACLIVFSIAAIFIFGWAVGTKGTKNLSARHYPVIEHKPFVFIVCSYNNDEWVEKNLTSIFEQKYDNYRVIYIDDASQDNTLKMAESLLHGQEHRVQLVHNDANHGAVENIYRAVHSCDDREIVIILDGDDWLPHDKVLQRLNEEYADPSVWATYGSYIEYPSYSYTVANFAQRLPKNIVARNTVRQFSKEHWCLSHMRTFYANLFKQIRLKDLVFEGKYYDVAADVVFMVPLAEMAGIHLHFIEDILYIYNRASYLNDNKVRAERQKNITKHILSLPPYARIDSPSIASGACGVHLVAFSFDRPLQLYALLESVSRYGKNLNEITVLYRVSSEQYAAAYDKVKVAFPHVRFVSQSESPSEDFKPLLMHIVNESTQEYLTCAVDDIILTDEIDFKRGAHMLERTGAYCFSYRLGQNIDFCYMRDKAHVVPPLLRVDDDILAWSFDQGEEDWRYQNAVDLVLYRKEEVLRLWEALRFEHPNSLETQWSLKQKKNRIGLCHAFTKMVNIPLNAVHISKNRCTCSYSVETLLEKFNKGLKIDISTLYRMRNRSPHIEYELQFIARGKE